jgi:hypothetical protein
VPFTWSTDIVQGNWWSAGLRGFGEDVGSVVPRGFDHYARLFHPVVGDGIRRTWGDVARAHGRVTHREMQFEAIAHPAPGHPSVLADHERPEEGSLPREELAILGEILERHTTTPERCWAAVWDGFGQLHGSSWALYLDEQGRSSSHALPPIAPPEVLDGPRVSAPQRDYLLLEGRAAELPSLHDLLDGQSPNVWWPADRAWIVATEIDFTWTYVGGNAAVVSAVLQDPRLEALEAEITDAVAYDGDGVNPPAPDPSLGGVLHDPANPVGATQRCRRCGLLFDSGPEFAPWPEGARVEHRIYPTGEGMAALDPGEASELPWCDDPGAPDLDQLRDLRA